MTEKAVFDLSVIALVGTHRQRATRMLHSVLEQSIIDQMEILIMDSELDQAAPLSGSDHPAVRTIKVREDQGFGQVRAEAVQLAHAPIVAFIEEHAWCLPGWAEAILSAFDGPWAGVGAEIHNANAGIGISDALALSNHTHSTPPAQRGEAQAVAGHNTAYRRDILLSYGEHLQALLLAEYALMTKLRGDGHRLFVEPDMKILHLNATSFYDIFGGYYLVNRCLGAVRTNTLGWPLWKQLWYLLLAPLTPWRRTIRLLFFVLLKRRRLLPIYFRHLFTIFVAHHAAVFGLCTGMLFGMGRANVRFRIHETCAHRDEAPTSGEDPGV